MSRLTTISKVIILGDAGVGKTSLINRYVHNIFKNGYQATIGADFSIKEIMRADEDGNTRRVTLQIWDTAGCERFGSLGVAFYRGSDVCVLVFDATNKKSFDNLENWRKEFLFNCGTPDNEAESFPFIVIANKVEKIDERQVTQKQAMAWCSKFQNTCYFEVSAKNGGPAIEQAFATAAEMTLGRVYSIAPKDSPGSVEETAKVENSVPNVNYIQDMVKLGLFGNGKTVPLQSITVLAAIQDNFAEVELAQVFHNEDPSPIECVYVFPLSGTNIAIFGFEVEIDGKKFIGKATENDEAFALYDDNIAKGNSAYIVEQTDQQDVFSASIGNLQPGHKCTIRLRYITPTDAVNGGFSRRFVFPSSLIPQYTLPRDRSDSASGYPLASPKKRRNEGPFYLMKFQGKVKMLGQIKSIDAMNHQDPVNCQQISHDEANLSYESPLDQYDFIIDIHLLHVPNSVIYIEKLPAENTSIRNYSLVSSFWSQELSNYPTVSYEINFVIDRSGSMMGASMEKAKDTLQLLLRSLPLQTYFNIVSFGTVYETLFPQSQMYHKSTLQSASNYVDKIQANMGGTNLYMPLHFVFSQPCNATERIVLVITDGRVENSAEVVNLIKSQTGIKVFALGIGNDVDKELIINMTTAGSGLFDFVKIEERFEKKVIAMLKRAVVATAKTVNLSYGALDEFIQYRAPLYSNTAFYKDERYFAYALLSITEEQMTKIKSMATGSSTDDSDLQDSQFFSVTLKVVVDGKEISEVVHFPKKMLEGSSRTDSVRLGFDPLLHQFEYDYTSGRILHTLAAKAITDELILAGGSRQNVITIAKTFNIVTKNTSLIAVQENANASSKEMVKKEVPVVFSRGFDPLMKLSVEISDDKSLVLPQGYTYKVSRRPSRTEETMIMPNAILLTDESKSEDSGCCGGGSSERKKNDKRASQAKPDQDQPAPNQNANQNQSQPIPVVSNNQQAAPAASSLRKSGTPRSVSKRNLFGGSNKQFPRESLHALIKLQDFSGKWELNEDLADVLEISVATLQGAKPGSPSITDDQWATVVALQFLRIYFKNEKDEYELMEEKSRTWLEVSGVDSETLTKLRKDGSILLETQAQNQ